MLDKSLRAVAHISSTVRGGRHTLSQVLGLSFRGRRPQARNGCAVPGRLAESYTKFSLSSIAVDDPTTEGIVDILTVTLVAIDGRTGIVNDVIGERKRLEDGSFGSGSLAPSRFADLFACFSRNGTCQQVAQKGWIGGLPEPLHPPHFALHSIDRGSTVAGAPSLAGLPQGPPPSSFSVVRPMGTTASSCGDRWTDGHRQRRHRREESVGGRHADRGPFGSGPLAPSRFADLFARFSRNGTCQQVAQKGWIGGLPEPLHPPHFSLHSIDRGSTVAGAPSIAGLPQGPPPSSFSVVRPMGTTASCERPARPTPPSSTRSLPFIASATANDSARGLGHGRADEQLRIAWDRCPPFSILVSAPLKSALLPSSSLFCLRSDSSLEAPSPSFHLLNEPDRHFFISSFPPPLTPLPLVLHVFFLLLLFCCCC
ncbi:hypothetical protein PRIPAC_84964 [Pristionchus pacificus]|uniref:Uncharacterized protein n=1 Tax=Pristionchus pacificus TaxID=54126 RepID=A0A2A6BRX4_PRIPA|nr:hypothetical protein PRIPAC_84964 [Pristionchus pacificus]|eukprot:PDM68645.1 hypothetical protein PRIPAC_46947 [Pristionchus pacificus]